MKFSDYLNNPHFKTLVGFIHHLTYNRTWKRNHPAVPAWTLIDNIADAARAEQFNKVTFLAEFTKMLVRVTEADPEITYSTEDIEWLTVLLDEPYAATVIWMLLAAGSASKDYLTPQEAAELTDTHESGWRNKAAAGEIEGAIKKGKQWLIPYDQVVPTASE